MRKMIDYKNGDLMSVKNCNLAVVKYSCTSLNVKHKYHIIPMILDLSQY